MRFIMGFGLKFLGFFLFSTVISAVLWEHFVVGKIYYCVWGMAYIDFFFPDNWYHGADSGDMIQSGWSKSKLLVLWQSILFGSAGISAIVAFLYSRFTRLGAR
ncbi:MAG: hypothetical protein VKL59_10680 [Nostocaceae cyanobacterium]|nr:hypothetical protein [Nostocaceae cyanobacterium]